MLIKKKDNCQEQIDYLADLLERDLPDSKKSFIERELKNLYSGNKGEKSSTYYLDFEFKNSKNWALIHDLRLEHEGDVAQIDHLLIGRMMDIYVIETKNFNQGVVISDDGDFSYFYKNKPYSIQSPIAQNERHIRFLKRFLNNSDLLPKRLGVTLQPSYKNIVLISPNSRLTKPKKGVFDCSAVMKADRFIERHTKDKYDDSLSSMLSITKLISQDNLKLFAEKLALLHKPASIDYVEKFGLKDYDISNKTNQTIDSIEGKNISVKEKDADYERNAPLCPKCGAEMVRRTAKKGKNIGKEFWGCTDFPGCRGAIYDFSQNESDVLESTVDSGPRCPVCKHKMVVRESSKGKNAGNKFWGCEQFPKCRGTLLYDEGKNI